MKKNLIKNQRQLEYPLVSVGVPTFDRPEGLKRTLKSITKQAYKNLEIIISDNCSSGKETEKVAREFMTKDKRITFYKQSENKQMDFNFRFVLKKSKGEFFMWAADDDWWHPKFITICLNKLKENPHYGLVFTKYKMTSFYDQKNFNLNHNWYLRSKYRKAIFLLLDESITHKANMIYGLWRRKIINQVMEKALACGLREEQMGKGYDNAFLLITLGMTEVYQIQKPLFIKKYKKIIPGSRRQITKEICENMKKMIRNPLLHYHEALRRSGEYLELIKRVYNEKEDRERQLLFIIKRILFIIRGYIL